MGHSIRITPQGWIEHKRPTRFSEEHVQKLMAVAGLTREQSINAWSEWCNPKFGKYPSPMGLGVRETPNLKPEDLFDDPAQLELWEPVVSKCPPGDVPMNVNFSEQRNGRRIVSVRYPLKP